MFDYYGISYDASFDTNGDNVPDVLVDYGTGDGFSDTYYVDTNHDTVFDSAVIDFGRDGTMDLVLY